MKIRSQLAYLFAVIVASLLLGFSIGIYYLSDGYRKNEFSERLREKAVTTARLLFEANQQISPQTLKLINEQDVSVLDNENITVYDENQTIIYKSDLIPLKLNNKILAQLKHKNELLIREGDREIIYFQQKEKNKTITVIVSAIDTYGITKLNFLMIILFFGWALSVIIIIITGWIFAGNALAPISDVIHQVEQIDFTTLDKRVKAGNEKDEIAQLAETFNRMLVRLQKSFYIQKSFVANASHELRTPLTIIRGQVEVTLMHERNSDEYKNILNSVLEDVKEMSELANELLDMAQASSDISTLPFKTARIDELILQSKSDLIKKKPNYNIIVNFIEAPDDEKFFELSVDERLLKNAFINLMENGCKFSADHQVQVKIFFREKNIILKFSDNGLGISDTDLLFIFEPFFRSENVKAIPGHGIGLPLTKKIIDLHGGEIEIQSVLNEGTTFTILLPRISNLVEDIYSKTLEI